MSITHTSFGVITPEHEHPVFNERAVRGAAGMLFALGFSGWMLALNTGDFSVLRAFGAFFMIDMFLRLFAGQRFVPSLRSADFLVRKQRPEWVDAKPKQTAWAIGLVMVIIACFMMGWLGMRDEVVLALCGVCMTFLFAEAAFGFCAGCWLHQRFAKEKPQLCSGDVCQFEKEGSK